MASAYVVFVFFIIATELNVGSALKCYQCTPDDHNSCSARELTGPPTECSYDRYDDVIRQIEAKVPRFREALMKIPFSCLKFPYTNYSVTKTYRGCVPASKSVCPIIEDAVHYFEIEATCTLCDTDGCNTAATAILAPILILLFIAAISIS